MKWRTRFVTQYSTKQYNIPSTSYFLSQKTQYFVLEHNIWQHHFFHRSTIIGLCKTNYICVAFVTVARQTNIVSITQLDELHSSKATIYQRLQEKDTCERNILVRDYLVFPTTFSPFLLKKSDYFWYFIDIGKGYWWMIDDLYRVNIEEESMNILTRDLKYSV